MIILYLFVLLNAEKLDPRFNQFRDDLFDETLNNFQNLMKIHEQLSTKYNEIKKENERLSKNYLDKANKLNSCINSYTDLANEFTDLNDDYKDLNEDYNRISNGTAIQKYKKSISQLKFLINSLFVLSCFLVVVIIVEMYMYNKLSNEKKNK